MDLSTFGSAGDTASLAQDAAGDASGNPLSYAKTAYDIASSLGKLAGLFGGGTYATNVSTHFMGTFDQAGYHGTINSVTTAGEDPTAGIDHQSAGLTSQLLPGYQQIFGSRNVSIPIDIKTAPTGPAGTAGLAQTILNFAKSFNPNMADTTTSGTGLAAPDLSASGTTATGMPGTTGGSAGSAGGSAVAPAPSSAAAVGTIIPSVPNWIVYLGLAYVAWRLYKGKP